MAVSSDLKVFEIFKLTVKLFEYRFKDMDIDEVIDKLIDFTGVHPSQISRTVLEKLINDYCNKHDTGINKYY